MSIVVLSPRCLTCVDPCAERQDLEFAAAMQRSRRRDRSRTILLEVIQCPHYTRTPRPTDGLAAARGAEQSAPRS